MNKLNIKPENAFLCLAGFFGILFIFITPPFQSPDEQEHFYRTYQVSELQLVAQKENEKVGGYLPKSLKDIAQITMDDIPFHPEKKASIHTILSVFKIPLNASNKEFTEFSTAIYSPIIYIPQSIGVLIGKILKLSPIKLMYLGRISNLAFWILSVFVVIRIIPVLKWTFFILTLMPMSIFLAASLSGDTVTNSLIFLFIAVVLRIAYREEKNISRNNFIFLFFLALSISMTKQIYFLIPALILLIPPDMFGGRKKYYLSFISIVLLCIFLAVRWHLIARDFIVPVRPDISVKGQILYVLENPMKFVVAAVKTLSSKKFISHFVGQLGWLDTNMSWFFIIPYFMLLFLVALTEYQEKIYINMNQKIIISAISIFLVNNLRFSKCCVIIQGY